MGSHAREDCGARACGSRRAGKALPDVGESRPEGLSGRGAGAHARAPWRSIGVPDIYTLIRSGFRCQVTPAPQVVGCNGALMGMLPWLFGAFLADFRASRWSWLQLLLAAAAILLHLAIAILQVSALQQAP